ncbi:PREDICTED: cytochrome c oxidase assembly protein COX11, mitochondrial isoform X2 [Dipodomys ordii]|uniref:Cytochrome c oxidase assembly protein COX11, mitochondrial isoform X2 n=1 Tax=Dipodomys ordii TaxID=10020 RepID=A0A1S3EIV1_DIPOR|nr:PREDICTED: cytochrome c oxidase assembly protein COX11, mitochondrial isoform X2 [Dipodomys ordii]
MGGLWPGVWARAACGGWRRCPPAAGSAGRVGPFLRPRWTEAGAEGKAARRLGTWGRPGPAWGSAAEAPRRPKSTNRFARAQEDEWRRRNRTLLTYVAAAAVGMLGASYAAVPLYRLYCQEPFLGCRFGVYFPSIAAGKYLETKILATSNIRRTAALETTGLGGSAVAGHASDQIENMVPVKDRIIKVTFNADVHASLQWNFRPQQTEIYTGITGNRGWSQTQDYPASAS